MIAQKSPVAAARLAAWQRLSEKQNQANQSSPAGERRDRALADRLTRGVLRHRALLDALLHRDKLLDPRKTPESLQWVLRLAVFEKLFQGGSPDYAIGEQAVALGRRVAGAKAAGFVNAVIRRLLPALPSSFEALREDPFWRTLTDEVRWSTPRPILEALAQGYGEAAARKVVQAQSEEEAPVWLRVNRLRASPETVMSELAESGITTVQGPIPEALRWNGGEALPWNSAAWERGEITVQDLGAMLAALLLAPQPGMNVLDLCAAPGGKAGHLWELMEGRGRLVALEQDAARREEMGRGFLRLYGADHAIECPQYDAFVASPTPIFDRVLIDARCMGLGFLRRHPEARWDGRLRFQDQFSATQQELLELGAKWIQPGGKLLWATCSPTRIENEAVVGAWLGRHSEWRSMDPEPLLAEGWKSVVQIDGNIMRTRPDRCPCDGFAYALLGRQP